ncbi:hypothetical protein [Aquibacillus albus]|uniref:Uncharacterized protein n=1 Tax=Aquibacillus albus TaxID=1168171 RepID=A0ABS2MVD7_9BACI|nr:hypothetical protein [Aquibacillus albus]MBM7569834.1 hypothetical protein [Aquibacillus albus]
MGGYYFYNDYVYNDGKWTSKCIQIQDGKFARDLKGSANIKQMETDQFWVGPGKVYVDVEMPLFKANDKERIVKQYIYRGCTLLLCQLPIKSKNNFEQIFYHFRDALDGLPIDYMIVPKIPSTIISPEHVRFFGRKKMPFLILNLQNMEDLFRISWEWMEQSQSFSRIPILIDTSALEKKQDEAESTWRNLSEAFMVRTLPEKLSEFPLSKESLRLTGISPYKGEILPNGFADYNLFDLEKIPSIDECSKVRYHKAIPLVTVMNGNIIKSDYLINDNLNKGNFREISIPSHFLMV